MSDYKDVHRELDFAEMRSAIRKSLLTAIPHEKVDEYEEIIFDDCSMAINNQFSDLGAEDLIRIRLSSFAKESLSEAEMEAAIAYMLDAVKTCRDKVKPK